MDDAPLHGADQVNDELEVGFDAEFERRWGMAEKAGRVVMVLFVAAALYGLLGRGPYSHHSVATTDHQLRADFEPLTRYGTATQITLHFSSPVRIGEGGLDPEAAIRCRSSSVPP